MARRASQDRGGYQAGGFSLVLDPAALAEAEELRRRAEVAAPSVGGIPAETIEVLAWFYWARSVAVPGNPDQRDWQIARALFAILYKIDPDSVPPPLRSVVAQPPLSDVSSEGDRPGDPREWSARYYSPGL